MLKAYIISTGTELLLGETMDTNSVFISRSLARLGIKVIGKSVVGDNRESIEKAFRLGREMADVVISSGGLGPTRDDLTKQVACEVMGCQLELRTEEETRVRNFFARRRREMPPNNLNQAMFPPEALVLPNPRGTAPGMYLEREGKLVILLPGPPREMEPMFTESVEPLLRRKIGDAPRPVRTRVIKVLGPGESQVEELIKEILDHPLGAAIALLARDGEIDIRITLEGENENQVNEVLQYLEARITEALGSNIFGYDEDTLPGVVAGLLNEAGMRVAFAESCTGGMVAKIITDLPGSSDYFWGGVVSYSNQAKVKMLGVSEETLQEFGAVSPQTAEEMARGIREVSGADVGIGITGIAGPGGGTPEKPVGLVYLGLADGSHVVTKELCLVGDRESIRMLAAKSALDLLRRHLINIRTRH